MHDITRSFAFINYLQSELAQKYLIFEYIALLNQC